MAHRPHRIDAVRLPSPPVAHPKPFIVPRFPRPFPMAPTLLVFSHLRWNFVYQRPQHLLTRLARDRRVVVVEEPVHEEGRPWLERIAAADGVTVLRPHTPVAAPGFHDD